MLSSPVLDVRVSVHLGFGNIIYSSVWVSEWPYFVEKLLTR